MTFSAYSQTPVMLGVYAYDAYDQVRDKQFINGYWYNANVLNIGAGFFKSLGDALFVQKNTTQLVGDMKTDITLYVPVGGSIRFLTPAQDLDVGRLNTFMFLVNLSDAALGALIDAQGLRDIVNGQSQSKVLKAVGAMDAIDIFDLVRKAGNKTGEEYLKAVLTPSVMKTIMKCIMEIGIEAVFGRLETAIFSVITGGISDAINFAGSGVGSIGCAILMNQDLEACYEQEDWTRLQVILFPE